MVGARWSATRSPVDAAHPVRAIASYSALPPLSFASTQTTAAYMASHLGGVLSNSVGALLQLVVMMFIPWLRFRAESW